MSITSRQELVDYALRRLGAPVIEINVDDDQLDDRIDEAIQFYREYHSDAIVESYHKHQITAEDVTNGYVTIPEELTVVKRILPVNTANNGGGMFNVNYQMALNDMWSLNGGMVGNIASYTATKSYIDMVNNMINGFPTSRFSRHMNRVFIDTDWGVDIQEGDYIIVEGSTTIDPETYTDIYNDMFLKQYVTALIKEQWGQNMSKFEGMQLPGGVTISGRQILEEARLDLEKIKEEMQLRYEMPVDFMIG